MVQALDTWAVVADITFVDAGDDDPNATLGFYLLDDSQLDYWGYFNPPGELGEGIGYFNWEGKGWEFSGNQQGDFGFITLIHELGHGLGLAHPHDTGGGSPKYPGVSSSGDTGDFGLNQGIYTTMSYNDGLTASGGDPGTLDYGYQGTPMAFDIAAIQYLYGANMSYKTGDDTYFLPTVNASGTFYSAIWDAGGIDKISGAGASAGVDINLNDATLNIADGAGAGGYLSAVMGIFGGFTIANGVVIENADGSDFDDFIIGNEFNNSLFGDDGNDTIEGGDGDDFIDGWTGNDYLNGGSGNDTVLGWTGDDDLNGEEGNDTVLGWTGDDTLLGGSGNDSLNGEQDNDFLTGGTGDDTLTGSTGADTFVFNSLDGSIDTITDFKWFEGDKMEISSFGFGASSTSQFTFDFPTGAVFFEGAQFANLENLTFSSDFIPSLDITLV